MNCTKVKSYIYPGGKLKKPKNREKKEEWGKERSWINIGSWWWIYLKRFEVDAEKMTCS